MGEKITQNKIRDQRNKIKLKELGWHVMTIWECQLKPAVREQTLLEIEYYINHIFWKSSKLLYLHKKTSPA